MSNSFVDINIGPNTFLPKLAQHMVLEVWVRVWGTVERSVQDRIVRDIRSWVNHAVENP